MTITLYVIEILKNFVTNNCPVYSFNIQDLRASFDAEFESAFTDIIQIRIRDLHFVSVSAEPALSGRLRPRGAYIRWKIELPSDIISSYLQDITFN